MRLSGHTHFGRARVQAALLGAWLGALHAVLAWFRWGAWVDDLVFTIAALFLWLGRRRPAFFVWSVGALGGVVLRRVEPEAWRTAAQVLLAGAAIWGAGVLPDPVFRRSPPRSTARRAGESAWRIAGAVAGFVVLAVYVIGPVAVMVDPRIRSERLLKAAPPDVIQEALPLSPLAERLKRHVVKLSGEIGERGLHQPLRLAEARDYVEGEFASLEMNPELLPYSVGGSTDAPVFHNVQAVLRPAPGGRAGIRVVGAHYDSAPGTPGADDNASGTAVLIELARELKGRSPDHEIRFVAFSTEEPPSFGTRDMGSWHYARDLKESGADVRGAVVLEMLGYFSEVPGSQLYPPLLHFFYPDRGNFLALIGNLSSRGWLRSVEKIWKASAGPSLQSVVLPSVLASVALSDQLNFWDAGFPAVLVTDTAFFRNPHYHKGTDLPPTLDYERMAAAVAALADVLEKAE